MQLLSQPDETDIFEPVSTNHLPPPTLVADFVVMGATLANGGVNPVTQERMISG